MWEKNAIWYKCYLIEKSMFYREFLFKAMDYLDAKLFFGLKDQSLAPSV